MNKAKNNNAMGEIVTIKQAAERLNLGMSTVREQAKKAGAALKIGRSYRININKLIEYLCNTNAQEKKSTDAENGSDDKTDDDMIFMSERTENTLKRSGIASLDFLQFRLSQGEVLQIRGLGKAGIKEIANALNIKLDVTMRNGKFYFKQNGITAEKSVAEREAEELEKLKKEKDMIEFRIKVLEHKAVTRAHLYAIYDKKTDCYIVKIRTKDSNGEVIENPIIKTKSVKGVLNALEAWKTNFETIKADVKTMWGDDEGGES